MKHFTINGIRTELPMPAGSAFQDFLQYLRKSFAGDTAMISQIKINGVEITESNERELAILPVSELGQIEVFTAHPREIAEETLQTLLEYTKHLENLCLRTADQFEVKPSPSCLHKLVDGIMMFTDAIVSVKQILRVGLLQPVALLEADLLSIVKDIAESQSKKDHSAYVLELLRQHLPENLSQWRSVAIPALIRFRDN